MTGYNWDHPLVQRPPQLLDVDSYRLLVDCGYGNYARVYIRLSGVDGPEKGTPAELLCRACVALWFDSWLITPIPKDYKKSPVFLSTFKADAYGGRWVGNCAVPGFSDTNTTANLAQFLMTRQIVRPYDGVRKKLPWSVADLAGAERAARECLGGLEDRFVRLARDWAAPIAFTEPLRAVREKP